MRPLKRRLIETLIGLCLLAVTVVAITWCYTSHKQRLWIDRCLIGMHFRGEPMAGAKDVCEAKWRLRED